MDDLPILVTFFSKKTGMFGPFLTQPTCYVYFLQNISLSVNDLVACCGFLCGDGCDGGYPISAWQYFVENGVVTDEV
jgi:hypothetical protein